MKDTIRQAFVINYNEDTGEMDTAKQSRSFAREDLLFRADVLRDISIYFDNLYKDAVNAWKSEMIEKNPHIEDELEDSEELALAYFYDKYTGEVSRVSIGTEFSKEKPLLKADVLEDIHESLNDVVGKCGFKAKNTCTLEEDPELTEKELEEASEIVSFGFPSKDDGKVWS